MPDAPTCSSPPCMVAPDGPLMRIVHCKWHAAGPMSLMLLKDVESYLGSFRSTPQRDRLLKGVRTLLDQAQVR